MGYDNDYYNVAAAPDVNKQAELRRRESQCRFLETLDLPARLRLAPVDQPVGAIGAAMAA